jgi:8-oxo-dGTP pyrophosphatase MutT (NUDIX family)
MKASSAPKPVHAGGCGVYIFDDAERVLLTQRGPKARHERFKWEAPGGAVEEGESFEDAARREIKEELGITVELTGILAEFDEVIDSNGDSWHAVIFKARTDEVPVIQEPEKCVGFGWFTREEIRQLNLADYVVKDFEHIGWL